MPDTITNFTAIQAATVQEALNDVWKEPQYSKAYSTRANTIKTIAEFQTAQFQTLENPTKDREYEVVWIDFCNPTIDENSDDSNPCLLPECQTGAAHSLPVALNIFINGCYEAPVRTLQRKSVIEYAEYVALGQDAIIKAMMESFNKKALAVIAANAGANPYPEGPYDYAANLTTVPADDFNVNKLVPYLVRINELNSSQGTYILDGGNLFESYFMAQNGSLVPANGVRDDRLFGTFPYRHDIKGFAENDIADYTFLIDNGAFAIVNRSTFPTPRNIVTSGSNGWINFQDKTIMRYSLDVNIADFVPMTFIAQGAPFRRAISLDVTHSLVCTDAESDGVARWNFKLRAAVLPNPTRCDANNTGVVALQKVAA